ncbi:MAG: PKD domain-containing protein, partial [Thermoplasmatota archaeon]
KLKIGKFSNPPAKPTLEGPDHGVYNQTLTFTAFTTDPDGEPVYYKFDWDDGETSDWLGPFNSGEIVTETHSWSAIGAYLVKVIAKDNKSATSEWSDPIRLEITDNTQPDAPIINGPTSGKPGQTLQYTISATDFDNHNVCFKIIWGDGESINWTEYYTSGEEVVFSHAFSKTGKLKIQVRAMDEMGYMSLWTILEVNMPRSKSTVHSLFLRLLEKFPILQKFIFL